MKKIIREKLSKLSFKQQKFVLEYLKDFNGRQAAIRAGYSKKGVNVKASNLLDIPEIQEAVLEEKERIFKKDSMSAEEVVMRLTKVARGNMDDIAKWSQSGVSFKDSEELDRDLKYLVSELSETVTKDGGTIRVKTVDKLKALELLGKYHTLFTDVLKHTGGIETKSKGLKDAAKDAGYEDSRDYLLAIMSGEIKDELPQIADKTQCQHVFDVNTLKCNNCGIRQDETNIQNQKEQTDE